MLSIEIRSSNTEKSCSSNSSSKTAGVDPWPALVELHDAIGELRAHRLEILAGPSFILLGLLDGVIDLVQTGFGLAVLSGKRVEFVLEAG